MHGRLNRDSSVSGLQIPAEEFGLGSLLAPDSLPKRARSQYVTPHRATGIAGHVQAPFFPTTNKRRLTERNNLQDLSVTSRSEG